MARTRGPGPPGRHAGDGGALGTALVRARVRRARPRHGQPAAAVATDADPESYALACEALAGFDLRHRLADVQVPLLVAPGEHDVVVPPQLAGQTATAAPGAVLHVLAGCGHLPPAEDPAGVAAAVSAATLMEETK